MNWALRLFAGAIDLLQFIFFIVLLGFQFITPVGGAAVGGVTGAIVCWKYSSGVWEGIVNAAACSAGGGLLGGALSFIAGPIGIAIDIAISCTFGVLLILLLWVTGRFSLMPVVAGFTGEMLPGINGFMPGWSILVHRSIQQYKLKQKGAGLAKRSALGVLGSVMGAIPGGRTAAALASPGLSLATHSIGTALAKQPSAPGRVPLQTKNFDGIRPANDNHPRTYAQAA